MPPTTAKPDKPALPATMRHRLIVITGSSGVGKSCLARALQEELLPTPWLHFSADTLFYCLPQSIVDRADQHNDWRQVDANAMVASAHACVRTLLDRGHPVIFDGVVLSAKAEAELAATFAGYQPVRVSLGCSWEEIQRRTLARGDRTLEEARHGFEHAVRPLSPPHHFDTTGRSAREIAVELIACLSRASSAA